MKRLQAFAIVVGVLGVHFHAAGAEDPAESTSHSTAKSPLAADGELQQLREPLAKIFQFKLDAGNLKFDRAAWESAAAEIEKKNAAAKEAEQLPVTDRIKLVELLLASLDRPDPEIDRIWAEEGERRLDAYLRGGTKAREAKDVLAKHRKP